MTGDLSSMPSNTTDFWSIRLGRWRGVEVRMHILLPLVALVGLLLVIQTEIRTPKELSWALLVLVASVATAEVVRWLTALRFGGQGDAIVLGPVGGLTRLTLPNDPPAHIATALAVPTTFFVLMVAAGCSLALGGDDNVLRLLNPINPEISQFNPEFNRLASSQLDDLAPTNPILPIIGELVVWVNLCLFLVSILPIEPCAGSDLLCGVLWPIVGLTTARSLTSLVAIGSGVMAVLLALVLARESTATLVPAWFPLAAAALFLFYGGMRPNPQRRVDTGLAIDEFDSDDELWVTGQWEDDDYEAVLVEHLQDKQQEAIDRKRREQEASEDARVDAILAQLNNLRFDELPEEDRAILKRASRRYRRRRLADDES